MACELFSGGVTEKRVFGLSLSLNHECTAVVLQIKIMACTHYTETCTVYEGCFNIQNKYKEGV